MRPTGLEVCSNVQRLTSSVQPLSPTCRLRPRPEAPTDPAPVELVRRLSAPFLPAFGLSLSGVPRHCLSNQQRRHERGQRLPWRRPRPRSSGLCEFAHRSSPPVEGSPRGPQAPSQGTLPRPAGTMRISWYHGWLRACGVAGERMWSLSVAGRRRRCCRRLSLDPHPVRLARAGSLVGVADPQPVTLVTDVPIDCGS